MKPKPFLGRNLADIGILIFLVIAASAVFVAEIVSVRSGPLDSTLFKALEFGLSIAIGWVSQRIAAREEFQRSLRQYALSAYRRISDIRKSVNRVISEIQRMRPAYPLTSTHDLDLLRVAAEQMNDTINSSVVDWADIIGEDLEKVERIQELQERLRSASQRGTVADGNPPMPGTLELKAEIDRLRDDLPYLLQDALHSQVDVLPREGRHSEIVAASLRASIEAVSAIHLRFKPFGTSYPADEALIRSEAPYSLSIDQNMFKLYVTLVGSSGRALALLTNPLEEAGVYDNDYVVTALSFLPHGKPQATPGVDAPSFLVPGSELAGPAAVDDEFLVRVPIARHSAALAEHSNESTLPAA